MAQLVAQLTLNQLGRGFESHHTHFLLNIKSFLGFRGRIPAGPRENTLKYNFKVHGRIKAREKSFDFSLAF